ncbi:MAG: GAF domain-containing protein [Rhodoferax sp.]|nr:GAF domain-containing protein [Rhodoferax sp.]
MAVMSTGASRPITAAPLARLDAISRARRALLGEHGPPESRGLIQPWIERSWQRCLALGHKPQQVLAFDALSSAAIRRAEESNRALTEAARPVLRALGRALADTHYFAILTNAEGVVVDVNGPIDRRDRRADLIARVGVDLSERSVGTTAIGAALAELQPVWLHQGEHFFDDTSSYSCAGAPLFGPRGECVGMLDLTGVDAPERPELKHLVTQSARSIENALALVQSHALLLRLNWPGHHLGEDADGLIGLDRDGFVTTSNSAARQMVPQLGPSAATLAPRHSSELFALPFQMLFDAALHDASVMEVPLWSGLLLQALALPPADADGSRGALRGPMASRAPAPDQRRLRDIETALIRNAVDEARGNVAKAALRLGVSRATVYRKLGRKRP